MEYVIVGDTKDYNGCLIFVCGTNREHAEEVLNKLLNNPTDADKKAIEGHTNLRIEEVSNGWWNDPFLAN